jgi:two-component system OmpR family response regulator/two-component system response regulator QseB
MRLLLAEDDSMLGASLKKGLGFNGYSVEWMKNGEDAIDAIKHGEFDLAVIDVNMPKFSGFEVLKFARANKKKYLPILLLTAADSVENKVRGLDSGADDYLTKPFELQELLARLRVIMRRSSGNADNVLRSKDMELDVASCVLKRNGKTYTPTANELKVLTLLMQRPGKMITKQRVEEELYGWEDESNSNTVDVAIYNLRKKLGKDAIITMRGIGYMVSA